MGWVGCYQCHIFCDYCGKFSDVSEPGIGRASELRRMLRTSGVELKRDGTIRCRLCVKAGNATVRTTREGADWRLYT